MKLRRLVTAAAGASLLVVAMAPAAHAATTPTPVPNSCSGVLSGADNPNLSKRITGVTNNQDGTFTLQVEVTTTRPIGTYDQLRDCVTLNGVVIGGNEIKPVTITSSTYTFPVTFAASASDHVCDRAALSGTDQTTQASFTDKSNTACITLNETPVPVGAIGGVALAGFVGIAFVVVQVRSRRRRLAPAL